MADALVRPPDWMLAELRTITGGRLHFCLSGGAGLKREVKDTFLSQGILLLEGYGLTETHGIVTANSAKVYSAKPESCCAVVPTLDAKLVDELGNDLPPGPNTIGLL